VALNAIAGGFSNDSYLDLDAAEALATAAGLTAWLARTDPEKESDLRRATLDIGTHNFHNPARRNGAAQALPFPREVDAGVIPQPVLWAQIFQASWIAASGPSDRKQWEGAKAGALKDAGVGSPLCPLALAQLARFISRGGQYVD
jgi:hypothetical protein